MALPPKTGSTMPATAAGKPTEPARTAGASPIIRGITREANRIVLYGAGGIGKTSLVSKLPNSIILDIEDGSQDLDIARISGRNINNWNGLREIIQSDMLNEFDNIILDTATRAEQWAVEWVLENIPNEKGKYLKNLTSFGYNKGFEILYATFLLLVADLDRHFYSGKNIIIICHDCKAKVPNPDGDDYIRWEPDLSNRNNADIRTYLKNWSDHMFYIGYDIAIGDDEKAKGQGTRTIYASEQATLWAKKRGEPISPFKYDKDSTKLWDLVFKK